MSNHCPDVPLRILGWCVALQIIGMAVEFVGGYTANSYAVISDAWHMAADVAPVTLTLIVRAVIQRRRRYGQLVGFNSGVTSSGLFNAVTLIIAGGLTVSATSRVVSQTERSVNMPLAVAIAVIGLAVNWLSHRLVRPHHRHADSADSRFDLWTLDGHFLVDAVTSLAAITFLALNSLYRVSWWDTAGGLIIGWWMVFFGGWMLWRLIAARSSHGH